jgi:hypothetical protein
LAQCKSGAFNAGSLGSRSDYLACTRTCARPEGSNPSLTDALGIKERSCGNGNDSGNNADDDENRRLRIKIRPRFQVLRGSPTKGQSDFAQYALGYGMDSTPVRAARMNEAGQSISSQIHHNHPRRTQELEPPSTFRNPRPPFTGKVRV